MNTKLTHHPVNWINGMAFSEAHLNSEYLAIQDRIRDAIAINLSSTNYGLLGGDNHRKYTDNFRDNISSEKAEVSFCRAVTQNGSRVEILDNTWKELNVPMSELIGEKNLNSANFWYVLLIIHPFSRIADGIEDEKETPRRKPHNRPQYSLELFSMHDLEKDSLTNAIPLAKFENLSSGLRKVEDYIPPCTRLNSHKILIERYEIYDNYLHRLKDSSKKIVDKIKHKRINTRGEQNLLADDIDRVCKKYLDLFAESYDQYKIGIVDKAPINLVEFFARLTRILLHTIETGNDKNHILKYFHQYITDKRVAELSSIIKRPFESNYVHYDTLESLYDIDEFLATFDDIFSALEKLDYQELAPRHVVQQDIVTPSRGTSSQSQRQPSRGISIRDRGIKVRRPNRDQNLGDGLE